jgi:hypothetical protein
MGVNAQTAVPAFTAGQVLTAAQQTQINTGIPVFATTTTRDAAFGGAGEKVLAEGQFAYIEATNTTQYYDGAAWQSVGVTPGLVYITGATFTTVASFSLPTDTFTATYRNYRMFLEITASSANAANSIRFRTAGTDNSGTGYRVMNTGITPNGTANNVTGDNQTSIGLGSGVFCGSFDVLQPQINAAYTTLAGAFIQANASTLAGQTLSSTSVTSASFDSLSVIAASGTISGLYRIYAYSES